MTGKPAPDDLSSPPGEFERPDAVARKNDDVKRPNANIGNSIPCTKPGDDEFDAEKLAGSG